MKEQHGTGLVELIESGKIESKEMNNLLEIYLNPMKEANIDYLVLGCSHYPYLIPKIKLILGSEVNIIDSGLAVAEQTKAVLQSHNLLNTSKESGKSQFFTNGNIEVLQSILNKKYSINKLDF